MGYHKEQPRLFEFPTFVTNAPKSETNMSTLLARSLATQGFPLEIKEDAKDTIGKLLPDCIAIYTDSPETRKTWYELTHTRDIEILSMALNPILSTDRIDVSDSGWDEQSLERAKFMRPEELQALVDEMVGRELAKNPK